MEEECVCGIEGGKEKLYILRKVKFNGQRLANLLLIDQEGKKHYSMIKNLRQLLGSSNEHRQHFCLNCLQGFHSEASRDKHYEYCIDNEAVRIDMPEENFFLRFHSGQYHFEVILQEETELYGSSISEAPYMKQINHHIPSRFCTYSTCADGEVKDPLKLYQGKDCVEVVCRHIKSEAMKNRESSVGQLSATYALENLRKMTSR